MSYANPVVYLDLDRTLFTTTEASLRIWRELAKHYPVHSEVENERQNQFYVTVSPNRYYYDLEAHLRACKIDPQEAAELLLAGPLTDNQLLMPGVENLVSQAERAGYGVEILTFGHEYYQHLKVALCPALHHLRVHVILESKGAFLADKGACVLVDDKDIRQELPDNVTFYRVQLEGGRAKKRDVYTHLNQVAKKLAESNIDIR